MAAIHSLDHARIRRLFVEASRLLKRTRRLLAEFQAFAATRGSR